jgi:2-hydroxy-6-oxonona-2,4-dienedioate hydrolase
VNLPVKPLAGLVALIALMAVLWVWWNFDHDIKLATARAAQGSAIADTRCGPIEYQENGSGVPLLMVHGSGGGHDQGMAFAGALAHRGIRVIALSRFGYLRTPMPVDASPAAQADSLACLLDALGIRQAAVMGGSAGGPSAMQMAIRHPDRVSALVLLVPLAYKPGAVANSAPPLPPLVEMVLMRLIESDFVFWAGMHVARDPLIRLVLATPPERVAAASPKERARVNAILNNILPVSKRTAGLRSDSLLGKDISRYELEAIRALTLIISVRDDGYGTYASAQYTTSQISGAKFVGFDTGGHVWVGHDDEVQAEIVKLVIPQQAQP